MNGIRGADTGPALATNRAAWLSLPRLLVAPRWRWLSLAVVLIALILGRLGIWQLQRREQKLERNALLEQRIALPPIELDGSPLDLAEYEYRRVRITGEYDLEGEIALRNRSRAGLPGVHALTPLRIEASDRAVIVDRGWLPVTQADRAARQPYGVAGPVRIEGLVRRPQTHTSPLTPADVQPPGGRLDQWLRPDVERIATQLSYPVLPFYVELIPVQNAPELPFAQPILAATDEGPHLGYAVQWFSFMATLLIGYAAFVVTRSKQGMNTDPRRDAKTREG